MEKRINPIIDKQSIGVKITSDIILFFDMDGTLVDTNFANFLSYRKAVLSITNSNHNLKYDSSQRFTRSSLKNAIPNLTEDKYQKIIQEKEKYYNYFLHKVKLNLKIVDILFKYSNSNRTVLVTNCRKDRALITLKYFGLDKKFTDIICREFSESGEKINKFRNAISRLGVSSNFIIAFENEEREILDAKKAGIKIINPIFL